MQRFRVLSTLVVAVVTVVVVAVTQQDQDVLVRAPTEVPVDAVVATEGVAVAAVVTALVLHKII